MDPEEVHNLANDPEHKDRLVEFRKTLWIGNWRQKARGISETESRLE
jgi:hypothetical protein